MRKASTKKTSKASKTDSKLEEAFYSDGKKHGLDKIRDLEALLDIPRANPFGTLDLNIFKEKVESMSLHEMGQLASRVGVALTNRPSVLKDRLIGACEDYLRRSRAVVGGVDVTAAKRDDSVYDGIRDLLKFPKRGGI